MSVSRLSIIRTICLFLCVHVSLGYKYFQQEIPNGDSVPDPSVPGAIWEGVGHNNANGGGTRNIFGQEFAANEFKWDEDLCVRDSDDDGLTNREELGDPGCVWRPGDPPFTSTGLSHPGICEPIETEHCQEINKDVEFESSKPLDCPAIDEPDVTESTFRFPPTEVPDKETNYYCMYFPLDVPPGTSEHVVAFEPITNNTEVMHHTAVYGCRAPQVAALPSTEEGPVDCLGSMGACQEVLVLWAVGMKGMCYPDEFGGLIGEGGYVGIWMEHHWNNPLEKEGMMDASGIKLYHTPNKRPSDGAYVLWGARTIELPANEKNVLQTGGCHPLCTKDFKPESIFIAQIIPHMHLFGRGFTVTLNDDLLIEERNYDYNSPEVKIFDPPVEMKRGEHFKVNCTYTTTDATKRTYFGESTSDEMCFAFILMYPIDPSIVTVCQDADGYGHCHDDFYGDWGDCDINGWWVSANYTEMSIILGAKCDPEGLECWEGCPDAVQEVEDINPCLAGDTGRAVRGFLETNSNAWGLMNMMTSCYDIIYDPNMPDNDGQSSGATYGGHFSVCNYLWILLVAIFAKKEF